jgi:hypothetical protein
VPNWLKSIGHTIRLFFCPIAFRESEVERLRALNQAGRVMGDPDRFRPEAERRIAKKRKGLLISLILVALLAAAGFCAALLTNRYIPISLLGVRLIRLGSVVIIAWTVLSRIGYETESISGETLWEITSAKAFKHFYGLGVFLATFSLFLEPAIL